MLQGLPRERNPNPALEETIVQQLRGGSSGPNFSEAHVNETVAALDKCKLRAAVMIDCSHSNSGKDPKRQPIVVSDVAARVDEPGLARAFLVIQGGLRLQPLDEKGRPVESVPPATLVRTGP